eukprot:6460323-Amphidinium_carterae.1
MVVAGVPFSWAKVRGGLSLSWIGFALRLDCFPHVAGLSPSRSDWAVKWARETAGADAVWMSAFASGLGRLGFAAAMLEWSRPLLGPLFAWSAAAPRQARLPIPPLVRLTLLFLAEELESGRHLVECTDPDLEVHEGELFRTDAKG